MSELTSKERVADLIAKFEQHLNEARSYRMLVGTQDARDVIAALRAVHEPPAGLDAKDLAELRPCYSVEGLTAFIAKHHPALELRERAPSASAQPPPDGLDDQRARIIAGQTNLANVIMGLEDLLLRAGREIRQHFPQGTRLIEEIEIKLGRIGCTKEPSPTKGSEQPCGCRPGPGNSTLTCERHSWIP